MKIFLVGMPGAGKTTLGRQLADKLFTPFIDLDKEIESVEQRSVSEIFRDSGEDYFRAVESRLLHQHAASPESFVMATGGGAPCFFNGMNVINSAGVSVFLDVPVETLAARTANKENRPLLQSSSLEDLNERLAAIRKGRIDTYKQARIVLERPDLQSILKALKVS